MAKRTTPVDRWRWIRCPTCLADAGEACRELATAPHSSSFGARRGVERSSAAFAHAKARNEPHAARVEKAGAMR